MFLVYLQLKHFCHSQHIICCWLPYFQVHKTNTCLTVRRPMSDVRGAVIGASNVSCPSNSETSLTFLQQQTMRYSGISVIVSTHLSASEALTFPSEVKMDSTPRSPMRGQIYGSINQCACVCVSSASGYSLTQFFQLLLNKKHIL